MSVVGSHWSKPFDLLRQKWGEIPAGEERRKSSDLLRLPDDALARLWADARREVTEFDYAHRGWYQCLYRPILRGMRVLDVGSGFGVDGITFAEGGAHVTFVDIVQTNLEVLQRLCHYKNLAAVDFHYLQDLQSLAALPSNYDFIWCQGSMINAPFEIVREESLVLLEHLKPDGRWIELAYPKSRWERDGSMPLDRWGERTDGGAPWMDYYDLDKILARLAPHRFEVVLNWEFHNSDFIWFDLARIPDGQLVAKLQGGDRLARALVESELKLAESQQKLAESEQKLAEREHKLADQSTRIQELEAAWQAERASAGWRLLSLSRGIRDGIAPKGALLRRLYDVLLGPLRR